MFKNYTSNDNLLLPPCLGDFIPQNDPVRVVHRIIEQINFEELYRRYSPQGCSAYHPRMMLQILVYAYLRNIYSSRRIEEFCRNDIRFMWLTGNVTPDHNTINRFRSSRLKDVLKTIFATIVKFLVSEGFVSLDVACTDGTKIEADANRYTFVWGKSIHTRISRIAEQLEEIWQYAESVTKQELRDSAPITYQDITPEKVEKALCQIDDALNGVDADRKMKAKVRRVRKSWPEQLRKYESQGKILDGRNSYSKTDNDATFMRMKEDHMRNGQLKPGYNPQISTNKQFILNYTIHQCAGDTSTYPLHMDDFHSLYGRYPYVSVCDAGYGSEENYLYAFRHGIETFIKYNYFHKEQKRSFRNDPFLSANFYYNEETDGMYCPMGQRMERLSDARRITDNGFVQTISRYRARNCKGCPLRCRCHRSRSERIVQVNHRLRKIKEREREKLLSDEGLKYRSQRPQDVEAVFGNLKNNKHFKRFHLRGLKKVEEEFDFESIKNKAIEQLKAGKPLLGKDGAFAPLLESILNAALEGEMDAHLTDAERQLGNRRNGKMQKQVQTPLGEVTVSTPRDRNSSFEPQFIKKRETILAEGVADRIIGLYALGNSTREISDWMEENLGNRVSADTISAITDRVLPEIKAWKSRMLDSVYPIVWMDAIHYKVTDERGCAVSRAIYNVLGINRDGHKELLGMYISKNEGANFWLSVLTDLQNRGVEDILIACIDGLKGFPEAIQSVYPNTAVQLCIVHQIRNSIKYVGSKNQKEFLKDLKCVYQAVNKESAENELLRLDEKWGEQYPIVIRSWQENWDRLSEYFQYTPAIRKLIYTTNTVEGYHRQIRKVTKNKGVFPSDTALEKLVYLAYRNIRKKWTMPLANWATISQQLAIKFGERFKLL